MIELSRVRIIGSLRLPWPAGREDVWIWLKGRADCLRLK